MSFLITLFFNYLGNAKDTVSATKFCLFRNYDVLCDSRYRELSKIAAWKKLELEMYLQKDDDDDDDDDYDEKKDDDEKKDVDDDDDDDDDRTMNNSQLYKEYSLFHLFQFIETDRFPIEDEDVNFGTKNYRFVRLKTALAYAIINAKRDKTVSLFIPNLKINKQDKKQVMTFHPVENVDWETENGKVYTTVEVEVESVGGGGISSVLKYIQLPDKVHYILGSNARLLHKVRKFYEWHVNLDMLATLMVYDFPFNSCLAHRIHPVWKPCLTICNFSDVTIQKSKVVNDERRFSAFQLQGSDDNGFIVNALFDRQKINVNESISKFNGERVEKKVNAKYIRNSNGDSKPLGKDSEVFFQKGDFTRLLSGRIERGVTSKGDDVFYDIKYKLEDDIYEDFYDNIYFFDHDILYRLLAMVEKTIRKDQPNNDDVKVVFKHNLIPNLTSSQASIEKVGNLINLLNTCIKNYETKHTKLSRVYGQEECVVMLLVDFLIQE